MEEEQSGKSLTDLFRKVISVGANAADLTLPKEVISSLLGVVDRVKMELSKSVQSEITKAFSKLDVRQEMEKFMETHDVDVSMTLKFRKKDSEEKS